MEELATNFKPIELSETSVNDTANSFSITQTDQGKVQQIINQLHNSKTKDIFGLDTDFIKKYSDTLIRPITHMINLSINAGEFPQIFKQGIITLIFGEPDQASNYRLILILHAISKVIEQLIKRNQCHTLRLCLVCFPSLPTSVLCLIWTKNIKLNALLTGVR